VKLLPFFDLPEQFPVPQPNGQTSVATSLAQHYMAILHPFEDAYVRNVQEQHRRATSSRQPGSQPPNSAQLPGRHLVNGMSQPNFPQPQSDPVLQLAAQSNLLSNGVPNSSTAPPSVPHTPHLRPPSAANAQSSPGNGPVATDSDRTPSLAARVSGTDILDPELQGIKRKLDSEDGESKRVRQKTGPYWQPAGARQTNIALAAESEQPEASSVSVMTIMALLRTHSCAVTGRSIIPSSIKRYRNPQWHVYKGSPILTTTSPAHQTEDRIRSLMS
jgi:SWI/SNF chromatin-remodeling complex subunit SWI1